MESALPFRLLVAIQSRRPDSVCSSLSYLPVHQHSLLDLSPFRYLLLTAETVPVDGNSMA
jgi:hypothetical protein